MPIVSILVVLILLGVILWLVGLIPMDATVQKIIRVFAIVAVVLWLITLFVPNLGLRMPLLR